MLWGRRRGCTIIGAADIDRWSFAQMRKPNDMSKCLAAFDQDSTLVTVIELVSRIGSRPALFPELNAIR
jgi:hypothetical protein